MGNRSKADSRAADTQERRNQALELRKRGYSYRDVARALGCSLSRAHQLIAESIAAIPKDNAEDVRRMELERLDRMLTGMFQKAVGGDPKAVLAALKIMERRAMYLGLDAPRRTELTGAAGQPVVIQVDQELAQAFAEPAAGE